MHHPAITRSLADARTRDQLTQAASRRAGRPPGARRTAVRRRFAARLGVAVASG
jgi:hypothetical protein